MFNKLYRGIKFGKKATTAQAVMSPEEIFFSRPRPYIHLKDLNQQLPSMERESSETFFKSQMSLELECGAKEIEGHIKDLKKLKRTHIEHAQSRREMLLAGESNVGKSSLINALTMQRLSEISSKPGKTRKIGFYNFVNTPGVTLVDCPGYGGALGNQKEVLSWDKLLAVYITKSPFLQRTLCLIDGRTGIKPADHALFEYLNQMNKSFIICFTKCDTYSMNAQLELYSEVKELQNTNRLIQPFLHFTSSETGFGTEELRQYLIYLMLHEQLE